MKRITFIAIAALVSCAIVAGLSGCSTPQEPPFSGFLGNTSAMYPGVIDGVYILDDGSKSSVADYQAFIVDPVTVYMLPSAGGYNMPKDKTEAIANDFRNELIAALKGRYQVVEQPGPGVLRIRVALTDLPPDVSVAKAVKKAVFEIDFVDTATNKRAGAIIAKMQERSFRIFTRVLVDRFQQLNFEPKVYRGE